MAKRAQTLTRDAIQYETNRDFSTSQHSKQNKRFLATALNTNETSKYTYKLLLTSADRLLLSKIISLHGLLLALEHTFLFITTNGQASADTDKRRDSTRPNAISASLNLIHDILIKNRMKEIESQETATHNFLYC